MPTGFSTRDVVKHMVQPLTQPAHLSMCELPGLFPRKQLAPCNLYAMYAWDAPFHETMATLKAHVQEGGLSETCSLRVDFLCSNLFSKETCEDRVRATRVHFKTMKEVVLVVSSPDALKRTWIL